MLECRATRQEQRPQHQHWYIKQVMEYGPRVMYIKTLKLKISLVVWSAVGGSDNTENSPSQQNHSLAGCMPLEAGAGR